MSTPYGFRSRCYTLKECRASQYTEGAWSHRGELNSLSDLRRVSTRSASDGVWSPRRESNSRNQVSKTRRLIHRRRRGTEMSLPIGRHPALSCGWRGSNPHLLLSGPVGIRTPVLRSIRPCDTAIPVSRSTGHPLVVFPIGQPRCIETLLRLSGESWVFPSVRLLG